MMRVIITHDCIPLKAKLYNRLEIIGQCFFSLWDVCMCVISYWGSVEVVVNWGWDRQEMVVSLGVGQVKMEVNAMSS